MAGEVTEAEVLDLARRVQDERKQLLRLLDEVANANAVDSGPDVLIRVRRDVWDAIRAFYGAH